MSRSSIIRTRRSISRSRQFDSLDMKTTIALCMLLSLAFFFQAEDGIRDLTVTGVQTCALPICAEAVAGDVDDVIDAAEDAIVTVGREHGAVRRIVRPVAPVLALRILVVLFVVLRDEALGVAPNGLHDARPGIADANVAGVSRTCFHFLSFLVPNDWIDAEDRRTGAARLHEVERRLGAAEESAGFRLPPGVDDDCFALANDFVIPLPDFRLDRFANGGHVLEVVVVIFRSVAAGFAKHADGGG